MDNTKIEWADATWNPVTGCTEVSPGCDHCYAKTFAERWRGTPGHHFERGFDVVLRPERLGQPLRWARPRRIFVNSMSDLFHDEIPDDYIADVFATMALAGHHTFQLLTKRHGRMRSVLRRGAGFVAEVSERVERRGGRSLTWPLPNVWLGVSVENQQWADIRIPALLDASAAVRFLSCEPLLGPVNLYHYLWRLDESDPLDVQEVPRPGIDWVIVGGESGHGARPMHPSWVRGLREECTTYGIPFLFKQWGEYAPSQGRVRNQTFIWPDGTTQDERGSTVAHFPGRFISDHVPARPGWVNVERVGKGRAGRVLDGRTWDEFPEAVTA